MARGGETNRPRRRTDRPVEPITGIAVPTWALVVLSVPAVLFAFVFSDWLERTYFPDLTEDALRVLHLARGALLAFVFAALGAFAVEKNWRRALARVREAEARARESDRRRTERERLAAIGTLAAGVAHEVGNPLASISAIVQVLERKGPDERFAERIATIRHEIERIGKILRVLLEYAKPGRDEAEEVAVAALLSRVVAVVEANPRAEGVAIATRVEPPDLVAVFPPGPVEQILVNLVVNGAEAAREGNAPGAGRVAVEARAEGGRIVFAVEDNGPGVPPDLAARIFDPFLTTKAHGIGLGLAIAARLAQAIGGQLVLDAAHPAPGARFVLEVTAR